MANFSPVEDGPLPPHERTWRHPSELGPPAHEPTTTGGRVLMISTATVGLLLVGVLVLTMTPRRSESPVAASSTISALRSAPSAAVEQPPALPLVTPVGDGWGVTTADAVAATDGELVEVRLVSGDVVDAEVMGTDPAGAVTVVSLPADPDAEHLELAAQPGPTDTVLVQTADPIVVTMDELGSLDVDEATPVLDDRGRLVGLCTGGSDELGMAPVDEVRTPPTTTPAPATTNTPTTVRPPTTAATAPPTSGRPTTTTTGPTTSSSSSSTSVPPTTGVSSDRDASGEGD